MTLCVGVAVPDSGPALVRVGVEVIDNYGILHLTNLSALLEPEGGRGGGEGGRETGREGGREA